MAATSSDARGLFSSFAPKILNTNSDKVEEETMCVSIETVFAFLGDSISLNIG